MQTHSIYICDWKILDGTVLIISQTKNIIKYTISHDRAVLTVLDRKTGGNITSCKMRRVFSVYIIFGVVKLNKSTSDKSHKIRSLRHPRGLHQQLQLKGSHQFAEIGF